jgi:DNA primase
MNSEQAKRISLPMIMSRLGYEPVAIKKGDRERWYLSPFRKETMPSFVTSLLGGKWIWKDFGDTGGTVIDFIMRHESYTQVSQALEFLDKMFGKQSHSREGVGKKAKQTFSFKQQPGASAEIFEKQLEFIKAIPIENHQIVKYLTQERHINKAVILKYLKEVYYKNKITDKQFFAFGMENQSGGYEIRAATDEYPFKSALNGRDITLIKGLNNENNQVSIFEGMTDFLSLLTWNKIEHLKEDAIVMHSLSSFDKTVSYIKNNNYQNVDLYLDNDNSGKAASQKFVEALREKIQSQNSLYAEYKDINDLLRANGNLNMKLL